MNEEEKQRNYELARKLLSEQNFPAAVIVGAVAAILAAAFYGILTSLWAFSYGFAAAGIGVIVGISMQFLGRGIQKKFAVAAAAYTIAGCFLGNVFRIVMFQAQGGRGGLMSIIDVFRNNELSVLSGWATTYISLVDLVFWLVAIFAAVFLAKRPLSRSDRLAIGMYESKG